MLHGMGASMTASTPTFGRTSQASVRSDSDARTRTPGSRSSLTSPFWPPDSAGPRLCARCARPAEPAQPVPSFAACIDNVIKLMDSQGSPRKRAALKDLVSHGEENIQSMQEYDFSCSWESLQDYEFGALPGSSPHSAPSGLLSGGVDSGPQRARPTTKAQLQRLEQIRNWMAKRKALLERRNQILLSTTNLMRSWSGTGPSPRTPGLIPRGPGSRQAHARPALSPCRDVRKAPEMRPANLQLSPTATGVGLRGAAQVVPSLAVDRIPSSAAAGGGSPVPAPPKGGRSPRGSPDPSSPPRTPQFGAMQGHAMHRARNPKLHPIGASALTSMEHLSPATQSPMK